MIGRVVRITSVGLDLVFWGGMSVPPQNTHDKSTMLLMIDISQALNIKLEHTHTHTHTHVRAHTHMHTHTLLHKFPLSKKKPLHQH